MERILSELVLGHYSELAVVSSLMAFSFVRVSPSAAVLWFSVLDRIFNLRRGVSADFGRSAFRFDLVLDGWHLDDESLLAQAGFGASIKMTGLP
jgi:hypothetical protein